MNRLSGLILSLLYPSPYPAPPASVALLAARVFVGIAFLHHGYGKWIDIPGFAQEFSIPDVLAQAAAGSQILAGALLIIGLLSPFASLTIAGNMGVAVFKLIARGETFVNPHGHSWEAAGFYALSGLCLYLLGPGMYSLDWLWMRRDAFRTQRDLVLTSR